VNARENNAASAVPGALLRRAGAAPSVSCSHVVAMSADAPIAARRRILREVQVGPQADIELIRLCEVLRLHARLGSLPALGHRGVKLGGVS
jgi:hypothetical protein